LPRALVEEAEEVGDLGERPEGLAVLGQLSDPERQSNDRGRGDVQREERPRAGLFPFTSSLLDRIKRVLCVARPSG
jgi:hypothetical protein